MTAHRLGLIFCSTVLFAAAAFASEVYRNDFSTRTSKNSIADARWHEMTYRCPAPLYYNYTTSDFKSITPYSELTRYQDGWVKQYRETLGKLHFFNRTAPEGSNPQGNFYYNRKSGDTCTALAIHPLYNSFSNGFLRIQADLRGASQWTNKGMIRIRPMFRQAMDPSWGTNTTYPLTFGLDNTSGSDVNNKIGAWAMYSDKGDYKTAKSQALFDGEKLSPDHWYRFVAEIDLVAKRWTCLAYDMGDAQPTSKTPTPGAPMKALTMKFYYYRNMTDATGPITGIGVFADGINFAGGGDTYDYAKSVSVDNLFVAWKANEDDDYESCYENDFETRRYRTLNPPGTVAASYPTPTASASPTLFDAYEDGQAVVPKSYRAEGVDRWQKLDLNSGKATALVISNALATVSTNGASQGIFVQPLGETITSGKVKLSFDMRTPDKWYNSSSRTMSMVFGAKALYGQSTTPAKTDYAMRVGMTGPANGNAGVFYPYAQGIAASPTTVLCESNTWYRGIAVVDLANKKYSYQIYELGKAMPSMGTAAGTLKWELCDQDFLGPDVSEIGTFGIIHYMGGKNWKGAEVFDNIRIWKQPAGESEWTLLYENDFSECRRYNESGVEAPFASNLVNTFPEGGDAWVRRPAYMSGVPAPNAKLSLTGITNTCVKCVDSKSSYGWVLQSFGKTRSTGPVTFRADNRAPYGYTMRTITSGAGVAIGGERFYQGDVSRYEGCAETNDLVTLAAANFGFRLKSEEFVSGDVCKKVRISAIDGNGKGGGTTLWSDDLIDSANPHWYRFIATLKPETGKYDLRVLDMGLGHPAIDATDGPVVQSWTDLGFRGPKADGLSALGISAKNLYDPCLGLTDEESGAALYDNFVVTQEDRGTAIILR